MTDRLKQLTTKKQQLDAYRPLPKDLVQNLEEWLKVELTYSSNAIEGNTLSRLETAEVIERGTAAVISGKPLKDQLEAINHAKALDYIKALALQKKGHQFITGADLKAIQKIILTGINDDWAGIYRQTDIFIRGSNAEFPPAFKVPRLMQQFVKWLREQQEGHPVRIAADAHFKLVTIHPFRDGNGRTARLLMNLILILNGYPMAVIRNEDRIEYLKSFEVARIKKDIKPFYDIIESAVDRSLDVYLKLVKGQKPDLKQFSNTTEKGRQFKIGELAKETHETIPTLRYWTKMGLLEVAGFTKGGYQLYHPAMIERVREIRQMQNTERLTIDEIKKRLKSGKRMKREFSAGGIVFNK